MNSSGLWIILLAFWVFLLQNRIKRLEAMLEEMKNHFAKDMPKAEIIQEDNIQVQKEDIQEKEIKTIKAIPLPKEKIEQKEEVLQDIVPKAPSKIIIFIKEYFMGGNLLVRIGSVVLFFGLAFLVKYAIAESIISLELRLSFVAVLSIGLIGLGWKFKNKEGGYGQVLQGLGIAILYLLIYATAKFYDLLSLDMAFLLMLVVVILGSVLAIIEDAFPLALFATAGGFLVPILTASGEGSHVILFAYYTLLNLGIFAVAWYRSWRLLNILGFVFTFVIAGSWGVLSYTPVLFASTEPFLILYFAMYVGISILFTLKHPYKLKNLVDTSLVFGLPVIAFPLQLELVSSFEYADAYSAIVLGLLYLGLYTVLKNKEKTKLLSHSFLALSVVFLTISLPYIFHADVSSVLWSLESAGIIWLALKQNKRISRYFGQLLLFIAILSYPSSVYTFGVSLPEYLGYLILITAVFISAYLLDTQRPKLMAFDTFYAKVLLVLGFILWFFSTPSQLLKLNMQAMDVMLWSLMLFVPIVLAIIHYSKWQLLLKSLPLYFPLGLLFCLPRILGASHPLEGFGALYFALFLGIAYGLLYYYHKVWSYSKILHSILLWLVAIALSFESYYHAYLLYTNTIISILSYIGYLSLSIMLFVSAYFLEKFQDTLKSWDKYISPIFLALSLILYFSLTSSQFMRVSLLYDYEMLTAFILGAWTLASIHQRIEWNILSTLLQGYFILGVFFFILVLLHVTHPFQGLGFPLFTLFIVLHYILLHRHDTLWKMNTILHISSLWFVNIIAIIELLYISRLFQLSSSMLHVAIASIPLVFTLFILLPKSYHKWLEPYRYDYQLMGATGLIIFLFMWTLNAFLIPYPSDEFIIPLFNLFELTQALVLLSFYYWVKQNKSIINTKRRLQLYVFITFLIVIFINVMFARALHSFVGIDYHISSLWQNAYFQTGLSLLWSSIAIILMSLSKKYHNRPLWIAGFGLLILIVLKLFFIELAQSGTIERIISFMVVGTLLLVIGYFVPLPPAEEEEKEKKVSYIP